MSWETVALGELVSAVKKLNPKSEMGEQDFSYVDISSVSQIGKEIDSPQRIPASEAPSRARQKIAANDILVSTVRPNLNAVAMVPRRCDGDIASTGFSVLRAKTNELNPAYLFHWVRTPEFVAAMMLKATGQSYPAVSDKIVKSSKIPLPPLGEQKRIAAILDQADGLRRLRAAALEKLNQLGQVIFHEMFGDPNSNPREWEQLPFGEIAENRDSLRIPVKQSDRDLRHGEFPYYGSVGIIDQIDDYLFEGEHLLISEDGKHLQSRSRPISCLADGKFWVNNHAHVVTCNGKADLVYLKHFLASFSIEHFITGIDQIKLNRKSLDRIPVPIPPENLQKKFRELMSELDAKFLREKDMAGRFDDLFASLQQRAFRGEL